jgi:hypothetical protein
MVWATTHSTALDVQLAAIEKFQWTDSAKYNYFVELCRLETGMTKIFPVFFFHLVAVTMDIDHPDDHLDSHMEDSHVEVVSKQRKPVGYKRRSARILRKASSRKSK